MNQQRYESTEVQSLIALIQTTNGIEKVFNKAFEVHGLTLIQYWLLSSVQYVLPNSIRINQLAKRLNSSHQNIKQICLSLENKGWIKLITDPMDKRSTMVLLNDQFIQKRFELDVLFDQTLKKLYVRLSKEDFYRISIILERLNENMESL